MRRTTGSAGLWTLLLSLPPHLLVAPAAAQATANTTTTTTTSKRGLAYLGDTHAADNNLLYAPASSIAWYYNWSPSPHPDAPPLPFLPLLHGLADAASPTAMDALANLPATSTHLLTFNEPDGTTSSGGSAIDPAAAARAYLDDIAPLRNNTSGGDGGDDDAAGRTWRVSHPATTGSPAGLAWLRAFNASCWALAPDTGCPADFVALHWYGDFAGLAAWLGTLREFYVGSGGSSAGAVAPAGDGGELMFWITEMALPQEGEEETVAMLNQSMAYLDSLSYVAGYAWYGVGRKGASWGGWTGDNVAVYDTEGALTDVGALYLGGEEDGFEAGMKGGASETGVPALAGVVVAVSVALNLWW